MSINGAVRAFPLDPRLDHLFMLRTHVIKALRLGGDTHTIGDLGEGILRGKFQYWMTDGAGVVTEILTYPRKKGCHVFLAFGNMDAVLGLQPSIEEFARANGCGTLSMCGRHGWDKVLHRTGWARRWTVHTKALT